jgi:Mat/Ecp fimbriae major subunit
MKRIQKGIAFRAGQSSAAAGAIGLALALTLPTSNALADTSNIPVSATILPPISLSEPAEMRFGTIAPSATAGNVTLSLPTTLAATPPTTASPTITGTRTRTGGVILVGGGACSASVACGAGSVQVSGPISGTFSTVTLPATVTLTSGANTITVDNLNKRYGPAGTAGVTTGPAAFSATGTASVLMTGRLVVGASQAAGNYTGTMVVTVDY